MASRHRVLACKALGWVQATGVVGACVAARLLAAGSVLLISSSPKVVDDEYREAGLAFSGEKQTISAPSALIARRCAIFVLLQARFGGTATRLGEPGRMRASKGARGKQKEPPFNAINCAIKAALKPETTKAFRRKPLKSTLFVGSSTWARTRDLRINSPALYQLSYRGTSPRL